MGSFYTNIAVPGAEVAAALEALEELGRVAYVVAAGEKGALVYDEECDRQDPAALAMLGSELSRTLGHPAWCVLNHDDDVLWYQLFVDGEPVDEYDSTPGYFEAEEPEPPRGGSAETLAGAFGRPERAAAVEAILRRQDVLFASERHRDLARELGIPPDGVTLGFTYLEAGEVPPGLDPGSLHRTG